MHVYCRVNNNSDTIPNRRTYSTLSKKLTSPAGIKVISCGFGPMRRKALRMMRKCTLRRKRNREKPLGHHLTKGDARRIPLPIHLDALLQKTGYNNKWRSCSKSRKDWQGSKRTLLPAASDHTRSRTTDSTKEHKIQGAAAAVETTEEEAKANTPQINH